MSEPKQQRELFAASSSDEAGEQVVALNARCLVRTRDGHRIVVVGGLPIAHFAVGDRMAETYAMVTVVQQGFAQQSEAASAFGCDVRSLRRAQRRFEKGGLAALGRPGGFPQGQARLSTGRSHHISDLKAQGLSNREIARRIGVTENAIRKQLRRLGWKAPESEQPELAGLGAAHPNLSASPEQAVPPAPQTPAQPAESALEGMADGAHPNLSASPEQAATSAPQTPAQPGESGSGALADAAHPNLSASPKQAATSAPQTPAQPAESGSGALADAAPPNLSASPESAATVAGDEALPVSADPDPADRRIDRLFAHLGLLDDAAPLFRPGERVPRAGVLLALPALVRSGVFECARDLYGSIGPAFYGLRTTFLTLLLLALLRIRRPEGVKEHAPDDLGRLLGLDRAPEVKTLRRKLTRLADLGCATALGRALARRRVETHGTAMGFLYVDGHVRAYHGQRKIPGTHVARLHASMPATSDYWVGDQRGEPLFVVTAEANAGLAKMLPPLLSEMRALVGDRRLTIVFDRGGYSPKLFRRILADGFDLLTYRKGRFPRIPVTHFHQRTAVLDGRKIRYRLADQGVRLRGGPRLRQVTRLCDSGHQTPILTSRRDLKDIEIAYRMFERWRQENFFKYLREEYALDALIDYQVQDADPERDVPNPRWSAADWALRKARAVVAKLAASFGLLAADNPEQQRPTMRGFKVANAVQGRQLREALAHCQQIEAFRAQLPRRVPALEAADGRPVLQLSTERKHLSNLIKMVAYQAESELLRLIAPHYKRVDDEGRTLVQSALASAADIGITDTELRITLAPLSSAHRTRAVANLCEELNRAPVRFPGTKLRLRFEIASPAAPAS